MKHRYRNKRFRGPKHAKVTEWRFEQDSQGIIYRICRVVTRWNFISHRAFWLHPTKGWRSVGPRG